MGRYLWLAVTADIYELPICVETSASKLGAKLGLSWSTVASTAFFR